jgi:putative Holliday junction resolvase
MPEPGRFLGVDFGARRIGLAVSDPEAAIAFPAGVLERRGLRRDLEALRALVVERGIERIVVGLPLHMNGSRGPEAEAAEQFAGQLAEATGLPVDLFDERWTTLEAERALRESGTPRRREKARSEPQASGDRPGRARPASRGRAKSHSEKRARRRREVVDSVAAALLLRTYLERRARLGEKA